MYCNLKCHLSQFTTETLVSLNKKCIFLTLHRVSARQTLLIDIIFAMDKNSVDLFRGAPYMLMLVQRKRCTVP
jgi:hypothetical protein